MIKRTTAIALTATLVSLGIGLPLSAQEADELPNVITQEEIPSDDTGFPDTGEEEDTLDPIGGPTDDPLGDPIDDPMDDPLGDPVDDPMDDPLGDPVDDPMDDPLGDPVDDPMDDPLGDPVDDPMDDPLGDPVDDPMDDPLGDPVDDPMDDPLGDPVDDPMDDPLGDPVDDPMDDPLGDPTDDPTAPTEEPFGLDDPALEYEIEANELDGVEDPEAGKPDAVDEPGTVPDVNESSAADDGAVIYPPADSVDDLEPADIVQ